MAKKKTQGSPAGGDRGSSKGKQSKDQAPKSETSEDMPGYPRYSPDEDITRQSTRIDENLDDDVLTQVKNGKELKVAAEESTEQPVAEGAFDVTKEDLEALGPKDLSMDMGDDEQLKHRTRPVDFSGNDLDVPGSELDDEQEETGMEDEENNSYSLGSDSKSQLDEGREHERGL